MLSSTRWGLSWVHFFALPFFVLSFYAGFILFRSQGAAAAVGAAPERKGSAGVLLTAGPAEAASSSPGKLQLEADNQVGAILPWRSSGRHLLSASSQSGPAAVAFLDGTIFLYDNTSEDFSRLFSMGAPLLSSHQALTDSDDGYFISCGEDWELYEHSRNFGTRKLGMTPQEYVNTTPIISADGGITLGSAKSTGFFYHGKTGNVISSQWVDGLHVPGGSAAHEDKSIIPVLEVGLGVNAKYESKTFYFVRKDYSISHYTNSSKLAWNITVAHIEARSCMLSDCTSFVEIPVYPVAHPYNAYPFGLASSDTLQISEENQRTFLPMPRDNGAAALDNFRTSESPESKNRQILDEIVPSTVVARPLHPQLNDGSSDIRGISIWRGFPHQVATKASPVWYQIPAILVLVSLLYAVLRSLFKSDKQSTISGKKQDGITKKRKPRKSGNTKSNSPTTTIREDSQPQDKARGNSRENSGDKDRESLYSTLGTCNYEDGRWIGKLFVSNTEIAKGSNGTVVFEGFYDGRLVAVKRLVRAHHDVATKEIQNLIASDHHLNIVRWFGVEYDPDFVYLALERCFCSLDDLIKEYSDSSIFKSITSSSDCNVRLYFNKGGNEDVELWNENGFPSPQMLKIMRDVVSGLVHLHELGIIHRDMKPQNVLISFERSLSAKLSDMGISKRLPDDMSSLGHHATGHGSSGWQAPEQLLNERQTRAVDIFSLGCVLFFCMTKGKHPFGSFYERDTNIVYNRFDLFLVEHIPEAVHLFSNLLERDPQLRPKAAEVLLHPLFWNSETRLSFLRDTSDRVELEDRDGGSDLLKELENIASVAFGGKWGDKLDPLFISDMGRYRKYKFESTRDLLRVIRNKLNHFRELPKELQEILSPVPEGFDGYFSRRFPKLFIEVYKVVYRFCKDDDFFKKYFHNNSR